MSKVVVLHGYSARNRGDAWLVSLTHELLQDAGYTIAEITTVVLDAESFRSFEGAFVPSAIRIKSGPPAVSNSIQAISSLAVAATSLRRLVNQAELIVGVGGGYLRAGTPSEGLKTLLAHAPQLFLAGLAKGHSVYLPQSIGPLNGLSGRILRRGVSKIDRVFVRDDTSMKEAPSAVRMPDLAALHVAKIEPALTSNTEVVLSVRDVNHTSAHAALNELNAMLTPKFLGVQSTGGKNEDRPLTAQISLPGQEIMPMPDALHVAGVLVAVRLHAAVSAIAAGIPTIHLSYERKGWGVFSDLGLTEWVHDVRSFDPAAVAAQAKRLAEHKEHYWSRLTTATALLQRKRSEFVKELRPA